MSSSTGQISEISGWGRFPVVCGTERLSERLDEASRDAVLSRGLGRSYGDASLPPDGETRPVLGTRLADRLLAFDRETGVLRAEAGLSLSQLDAIFPPLGWASPVAPGTQTVTLGGMVASDVHGKNHHAAGCFSEHVRALRMRVADGRVLEVSDQSEPELFRATLGGMGLTGHILEVEIQLARIPSPWIWSETRRVGHLESLIEQLHEVSRAWPFTVAWFDCTARGRDLGRGILMTGRWAEPGEAPARAPRMSDGVPLPFGLPSGLVRAETTRLFNAVYFRTRGRARTDIQHPQHFFYPLDGIRNWNRLYGRRGFAQYQCVIPERDGLACRLFMDTLVRLGGGSPVGVLKDFERESRGLLSFPMPGLSIAFDTPMRGAETQRLVDALNEILIETGGRIYLAKDSLTRAEHYRAMEPRLDGWNEVRRKWDPDGRLKSALSVRLLGDRPEGDA